jgi:hypothetical protein
VQARHILILTLAASAALSVPAGAQDPPPPAPETNPCQVPGNHLACPDLVMRKPTGLALVHSGKRALLVSTNAIVNVGRGPLEIHARRLSRGANEMQARQAIHFRTGTDKLLRAPSGHAYFAFVPGRGHYWKFEDAARFELWRLDATGHRTELVKRGPKIFYCFRDLQRVRSYPRSPGAPVYPACNQSGLTGRVTLGTSTGWADIYPSDYPKNWIDVTGLKGCFSYLHRADPEHHVAEEREDDNAAQRTVRLPWQGPALGGCPHVRPGPALPPAS